MEKESWLLKDTCEAGASMGSLAGKALQEGKPVPGSHLDTNAKILLNYQSI